MAKPEYSNSIEVSFVFPLSHWRIAENVRTEALMHTLQIHSLTLTGAHWIARVRACDQCYGSFTFHARTDGLARTIRRALADLPF